MKKPVLKFGVTVYLKTDIDVLPRQVISYEVSPNGRMYQLRQGTMSSWHARFEIVEELKKHPVLKRTKTPGFNKK